jgi:hypothetical protein
MTSRKEKKRERFAKGENETPDTYPSTSTSTHLSLLAGRPL